MTLRIAVPADSAAIAVGADETAAALEEAARQRRLPVEIVRTGSRGLFWLEPFVEFSAAGGRVAFGSEPIGALQYPWGLRLDGLSLWSTRKYGWLELGFTRDYFFEALRKTGWTAQRARSRTISPMADIVIATKS